MSSNSALDLGFGKTHLRHNTPACLVHQCNSRRVGWVWRTRPVKSAWARSLWRGLRLRRMRWLLMVTRRQRDSAVGWSFCVPKPTQNNYWGPY